MKILFWQWNAFMQRGMERALKQLNIEYNVFSYIPNDWEMDEEFARLLKLELESVSSPALNLEFNLGQKPAQDPEQYLEQNSSKKEELNFDINLKSDSAQKGKFTNNSSRAEYTAVLSVNYCPIVSNICEETGVLYISWVYDSPLHIRNIESFNNSCNRIYFFDRGQAAKYQAQGFANVYHMPLAADESVWEFNDKAEYDCDVAFVGQMYNSDYNYLLGPLDQYYRGRLDGYLAAQENIYGAYLLDELISEQLMKEVNVFYDRASKGKVKVTKSEMEYACACEITSRERFKVLSLLAGRCKVNLYSADSVDNLFSNAQLTKINKMDYVDYYTQMPAVFAQAKINLNISLKTIRTGIPLRALDVLSCGGFLITNYQEELFEYFVPGEDLVVYEDIKDLVYKVSYYLTHDEERCRIAANGQRKVRELFRFDARLREMLCSVS